MLRCFIWLLYSVWFLVLALVFIAFAYGDIYSIYGKYGSVEAYQDQDTSKQHKNTNRSKKMEKYKASSFHRCCPCCPCLPRHNRYLEYIGNGYWKGVNWYKHYFGEDTYNWFMLLLLREIVEILFQILAVFNYNGVNLLDANQVVLGYQEFEVKLFSVLLSMNCISLGIMWILYLFGGKICHGQFFKQIIFVLDTVFDTFYALFPIIVVTARSGFNLRLAVGVLQTSNMYVTYVSTQLQLYCPYKCNCGILHF